MVPPLRLAAIFDLASELRRHPLRARVTIDSVDFEIGLGHALRAHADLERRARLKCERRRPSF